MKSPIEMSNFDLMGRKWPIETGHCFACSQKMPCLVIEMAGMRFLQCEYCVTSFHWAWRHARGSAFSPPFDEAPWASLVLVLRERKNDYQTPYDVLMVGRKDEPGVFGPPGGKLDSYREDAADAACREMREETGIVTWPTALDLIYTGYDPRARMVNVYLCRAYNAEEMADLEGLGLAWKPWPISGFTGFRRGFYLSLESAFRIYEQLLVSKGIPRDLFSVSLGGWAGRVLELQEQIIKGDITRESVAAKLSLLKAELEPNEKAACDLLFARGQQIEAQKGLNRIDRNTVAMVSKLSEEFESEESESEENEEVDEDVEEEMV